MAHKTKAQRNPPPPPHAIASPTHAHESLLARANLIPLQFRAACPCCLQATPEDLTHLLISCPAWANQRHELLDHLPHHLLTLPPATLAALLIGGTTPNHPPLPKWAAAGYIRTTIFLSSTIPARHSIIAPLFLRQRTHPPRDTPPGGLTPQQLNNPQPTSTNISATTTKL